MTQTFDTGEIQRIPGEETVNLADRTQTRLRPDTGDATQNLAPYTEFAPRSRRPETTGEMPRFIEPTLGMPATGAELAVAAGYQPPRPDQPKPQVPRPSNPNPAPPPYTECAAQPVSPWARVAGADVTQVQTLLEALGAESEAPSGYRGRRRRRKPTPTWVWALGGIGVGVPLGGALTGLVLAFMAGALG